MALNIGPSAGMMGRMRGLGMNMATQLARRRMPPNLGPVNQPAVTPPREQPLPVGNPVVFNPPAEAGPIDTAPRERTLPVGPPVMGPPDYTNPYQTQIPDMAMQQNIGQNIRKTGGLRSAYGGSAAGLSGGPFRRQMFY